MFQVPGPIKALFDTFPLKTYPPIYSDPSDEGFVYFGVKDSSKETDSKFTLGVHGLAHIEGKTLPTDPFSLADCLILCHRHGLTLPKNKEKSPYSMVAFSYEASPTNELPILVEQTKDTATVIKTNEIQDSIRKKNFGKSIIELLVNSFLDDLSDLWILILLSDVAGSQTAKLNKVFDFLKTGDNAYIEGLLTARLLNAIPEWSSFKAKYPSIFHRNRMHAALRSKDVSDGYYGSNATALQKLLFEKMSQFERNLPLIWNYIKENGSSDAFAVLELKTAAFVFIIDQFFSEGTHIGSMIKKDAYAQIVKESQEIVLDRFA
ncbi:uncharacterized protein CXQ87_004185 [Candidozyma duobushaemuli]|uniref:Uncharacterized protein n=1 Tax=Candidozyma duobushaemuli TaxID=1231522 RepID=A0A2V1AGF9_9ASCO|nr:uncharacterized protein CXQ87_004185 [[Candida] duobushaemulonis]PVH16313.1 hypothetical protein CXQ87_004185 [[Candida] duobushaemulonis]